MPFIVIIYAQPVKRSVISGPTWGYGDINIRVDPNSLNADGSLGFGFDIEFSFPASGDGGRFTDGETIEFLIAKPGLEASDFNFFNEAGNFRTAAYVQGIDNDPDSGWIATPIPGAIWLFASGLLGLVVIRRKKGL